MSEYARARPLATFSLHGFAFDIVRTRYKGKRQRGCTTLLHNKEVFATSAAVFPVRFWASATPEMWQARMADLFPTAEALAAAIAKPEGRANG